VKLHVLSDLHLEFAPFELPETDADVVVLAGDTDIGDRGVRWALETIKTKPVIYVMGNHEYYRQVYPKCLEEVRAVARGTNVHVLENESVAIDGVRFFGCTFWSDFRLFGDVELVEYACREKMNDFLAIRTLPKYSKLTPRFALGIHARSRRALAAAVKAGGLDVVVTHHAPSRRSLAQEFKDDLVSAAFVSDLDGVVAASGAKLWVHGHVHSSWDYMVGQTRVLCNPRGYPGEGGTKFSADLVTEVG